VDIPADHSTQDETMDEVPDRTHDGQELDMTTVHPGEDASLASASFPENQPEAVSQLIEGRQNVRISTMNRIQVTAEKLRSSRDRLPHHIQAPFGELTMIMSLRFDHPLDPVSRAEEPELTTLSSSNAYDSAWQKVVNIRKKVKEAQKTSLAMLKKAAAAADLLNIPRPSRNNPDGRSS